MTHTARPLPANTRLRVQHLLDEGDALFFVDHPGETMRRRMYFLGERVESDGPTAWYIIVTRQPDGTLTRCFAGEGATA